jgi:LysM repeat protein
VYGHFGYKLERSSADQTKNGIEISKRNLQPGDLVFYKGRNAKASRIGHVGIVATVKDDGSFTFIHAAVSTGVSHDNSTGNYYSRRYVTARRIIGTENAAPIIHENNSDNNPETIEITTDTLSLPTTPTHKTIIHAVEKGQTLFSISKKYGCSIQQLKDWNQLNSNSLYIGQELKIETNNQPINEENSTSEQTKPQITHKVRKGETLYQIAKNYHCSLLTFASETTYH